MLNLSKGKPLAKIVKGPRKYKNKFLFIYDRCYDYPDEADIEITSNDKIGTRLKIKDIELSPRLNIYERSVSYIAGPSGSGKTTYALTLVKAYRKTYPEKEFYLFSRTDYHNDPAYRGMGHIQQVPINEALLENPINIENELTGGSILLFDDCNTLQNDKLKKMIDKLMADIMEVGRKLDITIIVTSHLVIPNDKKIARTIMNEMQTVTVFPKSGSAQQISYALKNYFGMMKDQIEDILALPSRWVTIHKNYPMCVLYEGGCYIL
jgi:hypothetical protein